MTQPRNEKRAECTRPAKRRDSPFRNGRPNDKPNAEPAFDAHVRRNLCVMESAGSSGPEPMASHIEHVQRKMKHSGKGSGCHGGQR